MTKNRFLALVTALVLLLAIPTAVFAQRVPPQVIVGSATLDGVSAADGAAITAWIGGEQVADTHASGGEFTLLLDQGDGSYAGEVVSFKISGAEAAETVAWVQGGAVLLDLVANTGSGTSAGTGEAGVSGAKGVKGDTGATGPAGPTGSVGAAGSDGSAGSAGSAGATGVAGSAGAAGSTGADGADGSGGLGVIALIVAIVALLAAGGSYMMGRRA
jgi:hypothetical protein